MGNIKGSQLIPIETIERVNGNVGKCVAITRTAIENANRDRLACKNFKRAVQGWLKFRTLAQHICGVGLTTLLDRSSEALEKVGAREQTGKGLKQVEREVATEDALTLVNVTGGYVDLLAASLIRCKEQKLDSLPTKNFRQAVDGGKSFAHFARAIAGSLDTEPLIDELKELRVIAERHLAESEAERIALQDYSGGQED